MGYCLFRVAALFDRNMRNYRHIWGKQLECRTEKLASVIDMGEPRDLRGSVKEMTYELIKRGHIRDRVK